MTRRTDTADGLRSAPRPGMRLLLAPMVAGLLLLAFAFPSTVAAATGQPGETVHVELWQAALIAIGYYLGNSPWLFGLAFFTVYRPLVAGFFVGIILGDPAQGTLIGAAINLAYLGFISAGGSLPGDPALAGWVGVAVAMAGHLTPAQAISLAVPIGLLGILIFNVRMAADSVFAHWADARAERADISGVALMNWLPGQVLLFVISFFPVLLLAVNGAKFINDILAGLPAWVLNGLSIAGGILPAIGIALNMRFIFRGAAIPYFFLGYILWVASSGGISMVIIAALGLVLAALHLTFVNEGQVARVGRATAASPATTPAVAGAAAASTAATAGAPATITPRSEVAHSREPGTPVAGGPAPAASTGRTAVSLRRSDVLRAWITWTFFAHANYNYERLQGTGFAHAMTPIIRRLYHTEDEIRAALKRHLVFFNTEPNLGNITHGAVIAMEEQRANGAPIDDDAINSVKSGLMGPLAGIGDTISQGTLLPIFLAMGISIAGASSAANQDITGRTGNPLGAIVFIVLISISIIAIGYVAWMQGYARGRAVVTDLLRSGAIERLLTGAGVLGNIVLGALAASVVLQVFGQPVVLAPTLPFGKGINLQADILDKLAPGILPLALVMTTWWLLRRRVSPLVLLVVYFVAAMAFAYPFFGGAEACTSSVLHVGSCVGK